MKFENIFPRIRETCRFCDICCKTYGWLLKEEADKFIKKGYPVVQLNNSLFCIDSFNRDKKGNLILDEIPRCRFYGKRKCLIQKDKPLDCILFPIKIKFYDGYCILGLSLGCKYISNLTKEEKEKIYLVVVNLVKKTPIEELNRYLNLMQEIFFISKPKKFRMKKLVKFRKEEKFWRSISFFS